MNLEIEILILRWVGPPEVVFCQSHPQSHFPSSSDEFRFFKNSGFGGMIGRFPFVWGVEGGGVDEERVKGESGMKLISSYILYPSPVTTLI